jgi:ketosteroid isomerase-like protein
MSDVADAGSPSVQALLDRQAIVDVTHAYCWALDSRDWDALEGVFTPDAVAEITEPVHGIDAIKDRVAAALGPLDESQHLVATHQVQLDGDRATCRCYIQAQHVKRGTPGGDNYLFAGRYEDRFVRTPDGWRIEHRALIRMWTEGNVEVLLSRAGQPRSR